MVVGVLVATENKLDAANGPESLLVFAEISAARPLIHVVRNNDCHLTHHTLFVFGAIHCQLFSFLDFVGPVWPSVFITPPFEIPSRLEPQFQQEQRFRTIGWR